MFAKNVATVGVENTSSVHSDSWETNILIIGERPTDDINDNVGTGEKSSVLISLILDVNRAQTCIFKALDNIPPIIYIYISFA